MSASFARSMPNLVRIHTTHEEVVLDLVFSMPNPNPGNAGQQQMLFKVTDRVVMSYPTAKRLGPVGHATRQAI